MGILPGDTILMHSSMKSIGTSETPESFLRTLMDYLGREGTLLLPALSYATVTGENPRFDVRTTPSCIGLLPEVFRTMPGVLRSVHPTHSVCACGCIARAMVSGHSLDDTPVGPHSPFRKLIAVGGKILLVGVRQTLTFMHGMEEIAHVPYCLKTTPTRYTLTDENGLTFEKEMYPHDFSTIAHQRYARAEDLLSEPDLRRGKIGAADCLLYDAAALAQVAVEKMRSDPYFFVDRA